MRQSLIRAGNPMMKAMFTLTVVFGVFTTGLTAEFAGKGVLAGRIVDAESGAALVGANVMLKGTTLGGATDLDGSYRIKNAPIGTYTLLVRYMGYASKEITDMVIKPGEVVTLNVGLSQEALEGEVVTATAKAIRNTEAVLLKDRQKSSAVSDAISAEAISQAGSGNAAEAMKQLTGASVVDGKYVFIRGLGDRYTSTQLNGAEIPSTNPYKRAGSIDIIASNLVDNIVALKSFTPDKPGNFSGGLVNIKTKDFPDALSVKFSTSLSYNSQTTLNSDGPIGYQGGGSDWLGMDDGSRAVPGYIKQNGVPPVRYTPSNLDSLSMATRAFDNQMWVEKITPPINQGYSFSMGNQINLFNRPLGFVGSLTYDNSTSSFNNGEYNAWDLVSQNAEDLYSIYQFNVTDTKQEVLWGGLLKGSYKITPTHIVTANVLFNQNGEKYARYLEGKYDYDKLSANDLHQNHVLGYNERRLISYQLNGRHLFAGLRDADLEWKASLSKSKQDEPDLRYFTSYAMNSGDVTRFGVFSNLVPQRFYRYLDESSREVSVDAGIPLRGEKGKLKFGGLYSRKDRTFDEFNYSYNDFGSYNGSPEDYFSHRNMAWDSSSVMINGVPYTSYTTRLYIIEGNMNVNDYLADQTVSAGYLMIDYSLMNRLRFVGGARFETTDMRLTSLDERKANGKIKTEDWLPSLNLIYHVKPGMNLRTGITRTLARPTMREMAPYASYDFAVGFTSIGNPGLKRTLIDNYDLRWEWFSRPGEIYAVSAFYKKFAHPIERAFIITAANREITWINVDKSLAMGLEFEFRKRLDILSESLRNFMLGANLSLVHSEVHIPEDELKIMRLKNPDMKETRDLEGQSPYLVNVTLNYENAGRGLNANLYYNVFGARLSEVNLSGMPYVYEQPVHMLNLNFGLKLNRHLGMKLAAKNLLNAEVRKTHEFKGREFIFRKHTQGRTYSMGFEYGL